MNFHGVFPPITTPFRDGELDTDALRRNIAHWAERGLPGIVALGSNGEAAQLDDDEADAVVATAREHLPVGRLLIAGTGRESTRATIAATRRAAALGADAVLVRTPSFFKSQMTTDALVLHYRAVADAAPVPVILYNFTAVTGINLLPAAVAQLTGHPNIIGVKESGGDMTQVAALVDQAPAGFSVLVGSAATFYVGLCLGAEGGILALACVVPEICMRLHRLVAEQRHHEARELQRQLTPLARSISSAHGVPGLKASLDLAGLYGGPPRPPLVPVPPPVVLQIRQQLEALGQLV